MKTSVAIDLPDGSRMKHPKGTPAASKVSVKVPVESAVALPATGGVPNVTQEIW